MTSVGKLYLDIEEYRIPEMDPFILAKTSLESKVFSRANITAVNIPSNIQGGTKTLKTILQRHGIETINVLKKKFTQEDVISNPGATQVERETGTTTESPTNESNEKDVPEYILITDQQSQMKQFKNLFKSQGPLGGTKVLVVEWNWCVQCIFSLEVSYSNSNPAVLYYE